MKLPFLICKSFLTDGRLRSVDFHEIWSPLHSSCSLVARPLFTMKKATEPLVRSQKPRSQLGATSLIGLPSHLAHMFRIPFSLISFQDCPLTYSSNQLSSLHRNVPHIRSVIPSSSLSVSISTITLVQWNAFFSNCHTSDVPTWRVHHQSHSISLRNGPDVTRLSKFRASKCYRASFTRWWVLIFNSQRIRSLLVKNSGILASVPNPSLKCRKRKKMVRTDDSTLTVFLIYQTTSVWVFWILESGYRYYVPPFFVQVKVAGDYGAVQSCFP